MVWKVKAVVSLIGYLLIVDAGLVHQCLKPQKTGLDHKKPKKNRSRLVLDIIGLKAIYMGYNHLSVIFSNNSP